ncbi:MAG: NifU family protein [Bacteroidetes bacterium]|nr:NifU family protein [Bacteroidota bacterium]
MIQNKKITGRIETALAELRPYLHADGGDVRLVEISKDMKVKLEFLGACSNCSMSPMTFRAGIEQAIRKAVPEIISVEVINLDGR